MKTNRSRIVAGNAPQIVSRRAVVLYDDRGDVRHLHHVTTLNGAKARSLAEHEHDARKVAARFGHDVSKLSALHVDPFEIAHGQVRVDIRTGTLVAFEVSARNAK
jgi:hypothetical protein